ncbi:RagB/SusD family nutrient uptake outer membrane protein [Puteibacter caeruleilacunae]|nr:RagB/SusD family nutrient uptake outer membrane protein [Puteibacter caeruleilacunae]
MRQKAKLIYFIIGLMVMSSCYELDRYPLDKLSSGTFWQNETQVHQGLMGVYQTMKKDNVFGTKWMTDSHTDIGVGYDGQSYPELDNGAMTATSGLVSKKWRECYDGVAQANNFIMNVTAMTDEMIDATAKANYIGEAKFLRALYYFELLNFYGGVPLYDETTDVSKDFNNMLKPRSSADEVRAFIMDDLQEAIATLPKEWTGGEKGRVTRSAAYALRGKVYLYNTEYGKALTDFEEVIKPEYGHALYADYAGLFLPGGDESSEMIFAIQNMGGVGKNNGMKFGKYLGTRASFGSCWNNSMPSVELVNMYENKDGSDLDWDAVFPGFTASDDVKKAVFESTLSADLKTVVQYPVEIDKLKALYENLDPRCAATVITPYSEYLGWTSNKPKMMTWVFAAGTKEANGFIRHNRSWYSYLWRKFVPAGNMEGQCTSREHVPINFPIIRLADVYLMMAECYNELNDQDKAVEYINMVRQRASVNMPGITETSKTDIFKRIVRERAVEFAGEGLRYNDLRRWKLAGEYVDGTTAREITGEKLYSRVFDESRDYLWPIPFGETEKNPALTPNPGWQ